MPVEPKKGTPPVLPAIAAPLPGEAGQPIVAPPPDPAVAASDLQAIQTGGEGRRRPPAVLPTAFLGNVLGDLGAALRAAGVDVAVPKLPSELIKAPSRGGVMVKTSAGWIQLGLPMWTNKDAFAAFAGQGGFGISKEELPSKIPHMIPLVYVVDTDYVDHMLGTDFLQYMFFVTKGTKFTMVAQSAEDAAKIQRFLDLSYEGPRSAELSESVAAEYPAGAQGVPNMMAELTRGFGGSPPPNAMRAIEQLEKNGEFSVGEVTVRKVGPMQYEVVDQGQSLGVLDLKDYPIPTAVKQVAMDPALQDVRQRALIEGRPGLWAIGTGHGFVPNEETSGFMIFGQGKEGSGKIVLVDPPSSTPDYLLANGIPLEAVEGVIFTHGHTDHYGDAPPKLLRLLPKAKVYTTPTIYKMLQEQYEVGVGGKHEGITQWNFVPVQPQTFIKIVGLNLRFDYGFHTVPTIGFDLYDKPDLQKGRCIAFFSGDTFADFANIWPLTKKGPNGEEPVMSMARAINITRHFGHIMGSQGLTPPIVGLVEAGMPPIHTDPASTKELLAAAQARGVDVSNIFVYHIAAKAAADAGVTKWQAGHEGFIDLSKFFPDFIPTTEVEYAARILNKMPLLDELGPDLKAAILRNGALKKVDAGTVLLKEGDTDSKIYFLIDGEVQVTKDGNVVATRPNGLFGEGALLGKPRNADVVTTASSYVLEVDTGDLPIRVASSLKSSVQQIRFNRSEAYDVVKNHSPLSILPDSILDVLFLKARTYPIVEGTTFIHEGASDKGVYVVLEGTVRVHSATKGIDVQLGAGAMLGEMALVDSKTRTASVTADGPVKVIRWTADSLQTFIDKYPGIAIAMGRTAEKREARNGSGENGVRPSQGEAGYATVETLALPFIAPLKLAEFLADKMPQAAANTLKGGFVFLAGDQLSEMLLGNFHMPDVKAVAQDYATLTAGGKIGELGLGGALSLPAAQGISQSARAVLGRAVPLFSALIAQEWVREGRVNLAQLPVSAGNVLVASGIVSGATGALAASETALNLGRVLRLVSLGGKATLLGAVVTSAAEFTPIKAFNQIAAQVAESGAFEEVTVHLGELLSADGRAIDALSHGQEIPAGYLEAIDQQLATYEQGLANRPGLVVRQTETEYAEKLTALRDNYEAKVSRPLDGTWSRAEVMEAYEARRHTIEMQRDAEIAMARSQEDHHFTRMAVEPNQVADQLLDRVDEDTLKADVDMDGNPRYDAPTLQYQTLLARDWAGLSAQIAQYRRDRAEVIQRYQRQLPPKVEPQQLAML